MPKYAKLLFVFWFFPNYYHVSASNPLVFVYFVNFGLNSEGISLLSVGLMLGLVSRELGEKMHDCGREETSKHKWIRSIMTQKEIRGYIFLQFSEPTRKPFLQVSFVPLATSSRFHQDMFKIYYIPLLNYCLFYLH